MRGYPLDETPGLALRRRSASYASALPPLSTYTNLEPGSALANSLSQSCLLNIT